MPVRTRSALRSTAIKWLDVEPEVRNMILEDVISCSLTTDASGKPGLAPLASVCQEWRAFFEHHIFRRLVLDNDDIEFFSKALAPPNEIRIKYIKHIRLRVTLSPYECPDCRKSESWLTRSANNQRFTEAVRGLLSVLSRWDPALYSTRIALELSAHSPSDCQHGFNHLYLRPEFPYQCAEDLERPPGLPTYLPERWWDAMQARNEHMYGGFDQVAERARFEGSPLGLVDSGSSGITRMANPFPPCPIVKEFGIRFTCHRTFNGRSIAQILQALTELESFRWERWDPDGDISLFYHNFVQHLRSGLSPTVHQVYLAYIPKRIGPHRLQSISSNTHEVVYMAQGLRNLCIDTDIEALWFLRRLAGQLVPQDRFCFYPMPQRPWENLERLLIHDTTFVPALDWEAMNRVSEWAIPAHKVEYERNYEPPPNDPLYWRLIRLSEGLLQACRAARRLPNLRVMELAHISSILTPFIYIFTYSSHGERESAKITLHLARNTALYLTPEVCEAWRRTAVDVHGHVRFLPPETIYMPDSVWTIRESHGWCLTKYLALRDLWLDPTTVAQFEAETKWIDRRESWIRTVPIDRRTFQDAI